MSTQPTNAGIDFQQRISAWIMINMLFDIDLSNSFDIANNTLIEKIAFETNDVIDDLVVTTNTNQKLYYQMKRTVNLSDRNNSDFFKAINQFVKQYIKVENDNTNYVLVTSSNSSSPVTSELKRILESIRINPLSFIENPLSQKERNTYDKFKSMVLDIYRENTNLEMTDQKFLSFATKVIITVLDIEEGMPFEKVVLLTLNNNAPNTPPKLLWSYIIKSCINFASNRMSVLKNELKENWKSYISNSNSSNTDEQIDEELMEEYVNVSFGDLDFSVGKDVVLVEGNYELGEDAADKLLIMELYRFDDDGTKRVEYQGNQIILKNGLKFNVLHRTATMVGMIRYVEENESLLPRSKDVVIFNVKDIENVEGEPFVKIHLEHCKKYVETNKQKFYNCIHCAKGISENSLIVEIDDFYEHSILGLVHKDCLRPVDRVLGEAKSDLFDHFEYLKKFDYNLWIKSLKESQALVGGLIGGNYPSVIRMAWDPFGGTNEQFKHCIKMNLSNGDFTYLKERGKINRVNKSEAKKIVKDFNQMIEKQKKLDDPLGYTSKKMTFGSYSLLIRTKGDDEDIIECVSAEVDNYIDHLGNLYNTNKNYYAPLLTITQLDVEEHLVIDNRLVFISDPLSLNNFINNWTNANIVLSNYELNIIADDNEFDMLLRGNFRDGIKGVIDPIVDRKGKIVKGILLESIYEMQRR
ncbi:hypothetical protein NYE70_08420 [Paenibacillus sp. FSL R5-0407]|uniref:hypothetical protein n=1 Tax=Paenibacillus sp. FSL R5-0407 TaxID=2975320 RepID=UPI0030FA2ABD